MNASTNCKGCRYFANMHDSKGFLHYYCKSCQQNICSLMYCPVENPNEGYTFHWILCTDALPTETDGYVLALMPNESPYNGMQPFPNCKQTQRIELKHYAGDRWWGYGGSLGGADPIAWAYLPPFIGW